jgi:hypothetical protein
MTRQAFVKVVKNIRAMLASGRDAACTCPKVKCEWHGKCYECVRIHRHFRDHVPNCLQFMLQDEVKELARVAECTVAPKPKTPDAYWDRVRRDAPAKGRKARAGSG